MDRVLNCQFYRRFGVEIELNTLNGVIADGKEQMPFGADIIAEIVNKVVDHPVEVQTWDHNFNNKCWIIKHDRSCGLEVCTPILKGWYGLKQLIQVVEKFKFYNLPADKRCSLHVHLNIGDLSKNQLASVIAWYIKCEHVFFDSVPACRKLNRYCQMIGASDIIQVDEYFDDPYWLIEKISPVKYFSLNAYHFVKGGGFSSKNTRKKTIEFRIGENDFCLNGYAVKNWIRFLMHFIEVTKDLGMPEYYQSGDPWTGFSWLNTDDVLKLLKFDQVNSAGLEQVKNWFIYRLLKNGLTGATEGMWSNEVRQYERNLLLDFINQYKIEVFNQEYGDIELYGENYAL